MEGLTNGVDKSPVPGDVAAGTHKATRVTSTSSSVASPMSSSTGISSGSSNGAISASVPSSSLAMSNRGGGGAVQRTPPALLSSPKSRRAKLTLNVKPSAAAVVVCPMCPHTEATAAKMEEHVNRRHFDLTSPDEDSNGDPDGSGGTTRKVSKRLT